MAGLTQEQQDQYTQDALNQGVPQSFIDQFTAQNGGDQNRLVSAYNSQQTGQGVDSSITGGAWQPTGKTASNTPQTPTQAWNSYGSQSNDFYGQLAQRIGQANAPINPNDPTITSQLNPFRAEQTRAARDFISNSAEQQGPYANIQGERRLAAQTAGQNTSDFLGQLMARQQGYNQNNASQALALEGGQLSSDQARQLQAALGFGGLNLQSQLGFAGLNQSQDQFLRELALRQWQAGDSSNLAWASL